MKRIIIHLSSVDRDFSIYKRPSYYRFSANKIDPLPYGKMHDISDFDMRRVHGIRLIGATFPNIVDDSVQAYETPYFQISLAEIKKSVFVHTNPTTRGVVGIAYYNNNKEDQYSSINAHKIIPEEPITNMFGENLSTLTVSILDAYGNEVNFGNDYVQISTSVPISTTDTVFTTVDKHGLQSDDKIYIKDHEVLLNSGIWTIDNNVNNYETGYYVQRISDTEFSIKLNTSLYNGGRNGFLIEIKKQNHLVFELTQ